MTQFMLSENLNDMQMVCKLYLMTPIDSTLPPRLMYCSG